MSRKISTFFLPLILIFLISNSIYSQDLDIDCFGIACGTVQANWELANGEAFVCEGTDFQLRSGGSTPLNNINEYQWYFVDKATGEIARNSATDRKPHETAIFAVQALFWNGNLIFCNQALIK